MVLRTRLTDRLGIRHPVLLAPMGFVSGGALAAAVSAAGGLEEGAEIIIAQSGEAGMAERARYAAAAAAGDPGTAVVFAGEGIDLIHEVEPAGVILERVIGEAEAALARRFV